MPFVLYSQEETHTIIRRLFSMGHIPVMKGMSSHTCYGLLYKNNSMARSYLYHRICAVLF